MGGGFVELPVDVLSVADADDKYDQFAIDDLIDDPVGTNSDTTESRKFALQRSTTGRCLAKEVDRFDQSYSVRLGNPEQRLCGASLNLHREDHV